MDLSSFTRFAVVFHGPSESVECIDQIGSNQIDVGQFSRRRCTQCHRVDRMKSTDRGQIDELKNENRLRDEKECFVGKANLGLSIEHQFL